MKDKNEMIINIETIDMEMEKPLKITTKCIIMTENECSNRYNKDSEILEEELIPGISSVELKNNIKDNNEDNIEKLTLLHTNKAGIRKSLDDGDIVLMKKGNDKRSNNNKDRVLLRNAKL